MPNLAPLVGIGDPGTRRVLQSIYDALGAMESRSQQSPTASPANTVVLVQQQVQQQVAAAVRDAGEQLARRVALPRPDALVRSVLEGSGLERPIELSQPVVFKAGTSTRGVFIGAGGIIGASDNVTTFTISSADGSFFFGPETDPTRQLAFTPGSGADLGSLVIGRNIVVVDDSGNPRGVGAVASTAYTANATANAANSAAAAALSSLSGKLNRTGGDILSGPVSFTDAGGFKTSGITINSDGSSSGTGVAITSKGIVGRNASGVTFTLDATTGSATFRGNIDTGGQVYARGVTSVTSGAASGYSAAVVGDGVSSNAGVLAIAGLGAYGLVAFGSGSVSGAAGYLYNNGGRALITVGTVDMTGPVGGTCLTVNTPFGTAISTTGDIKVNGTSVSLADHTHTGYALAGHTHAMPTSFTCSVTDNGNGTFTLSNIYANTST